MSNETEKSTGTYGGVGIMHDDKGRLIIGQMPRITMHADQEQEMANGVSIPIGPKRPILDMQPTIIPFADLIQALIEQNDTGKPTDFLGHVRVRPTAPNERFHITDEGVVVVTADGA